MRDDQPGATCRPTHRYFTYTYIYIYTVYSPGSYVAVHAVSTAFPAQEQELDPPASSCYLRTCQRDTDRQFDNARSQMYRHMNAATPHLLLSVSKQIGARVRMPMTPSLPHMLITLAVLLVTACMPGHAGGVVIGQPPAAAAARTGGRAGGWGMHARSPSEIDDFTAESLRARTLTAATGADIIDATGSGSSRTLSDAADPDAIIIGAEVFIEEEEGIEYEDLGVVSECPADLQGMELMPRTGRRLQMYCYSCAPPATTPSSMGDMHAHA